jgi:Fe-S-cluster-containing hydrogenase component 2
LCREGCPESAIRPKLLEPRHLYEVIAEKCTGCGECLDYCPAPWCNTPRDYGRGSGHMQQEEPSSVVFRVRFGREQFTCKGHLVREGGIVYAVVDEMPDNCPFPPDQVKLEESDLELKHNEDGGAYYQHHGFIFVY